MEQLGRGEATRLSVAGFFLSPGGSGGPKKIGVKNSNPQKKTPNFFSARPGGPTSTSDLLLGIDKPRTERLGEGQWHGEGRYISWQTPRRGPGALDEGRLAPALSCIMTAPWPEAGPWTTYSFSALSPRMK